MLAESSPVMDEEYYLQHGDPRQESWFMMSSPQVPVLVCALWLAFVKGLGPALMRRHNPLDLRALILPYNFAMVACNAVLCCSLMSITWLDKYRWRCEPIDFSDDPAAVRVAEIMYYIYSTRLLELADTVFFVLRKKDAQVTTLHVVHHLSVPLFSWYGMKFGPGGYNTIFPITNCFVHVWMYLYYGLSAMGPKVQKYLWWKKYLTKLQLAQFVVVLAWFSQAWLFPVEGCRISGLLFAANVGPAVIFLALFADFYLGTYRKNKKA